MDAALKAKWVEALRSGEYKQVHGNLKNGDSFCCLGVLCVVSGIGFDGSDCPAVKDWDGEYASLLPLTKQQAEDLWRRNDAIGLREHSFAQIADYIEANL